MGERGDDQTRAKIEKELGLDLGFTKQYLLYLNDLSPLSIHNKKYEESRIYLDPEDYSYLALFDFKESRTLVIKKPFLRRSYQNGQSVSEIISNTFPGTALLALIAISIALILGVLIGTLAALNQNSFFDRSSLFVAVLGMSGPSFFIAIIISWIGGFLWHQSTDLPLFPIVVFLILFLVTSFSAFRHNKLTAFFILNKAFKYAVLSTVIWLFIHLIKYIFSIDNLPGFDTHLHLPGTGLNQSGSLKEVDVFSGPYYEWKNLVLPAITLGIRPLAVVIQLTRNAMIDTLQQSFIRTARAKGLSEFQMVLRHALRNAISPVLTAISGWFASMLAGAVFVEYVFGWQGLGLQIYEALINEDMPLVMGAVLFISIIFVVLNLLLDLVYTYLDPRIKL